MRKLFANFLTMFSGFFILSGLCAQPPVISYDPVITGLSAPIDIVNAGDGSNRLFIVQQAGLIKMWNGTSLTDFIDLGATGANIISYGGERGLLSMAFHPGYDGITNQYFFVYYTDLNGDVALKRFQTTAGDPNTGDLSSGQLILTIPHPGQSNHNGGKLNFGPDGNLYFATGDGGGGNDVPNNAQNPMSLLGKMLRINVDNFTTPPYYTVPADNPFASDPSFDSRIFNLGLRNPFRWSFDRENGNMWIGDVGQDAKEEIDFRAAGNTGHNNFGWRCYEGYISTPGVTDCDPVDNVFPVYDYDNPSPGSSAVTGGYVYRGPDYPAFRGYYIAADVYSGTLYFLWPNGSGGFDSSFQNGLQNFIVGFGEAEDGALYAVSQGTNEVYKVSALGGTALPTVLKNFSAMRFSNYNELRWTTAAQQNITGFDIGYGGESSNFISIGSLVANRNANESNYVFQHRLNSNSTAYYRLTIKYDNGSVKHSSILKVFPGTDEAIHIYPSLINNGVINVSMPMSAEKFRLINTGGAVVFEKNLKNISGTVAINLPPLPKGLYIVQVWGTGEVKVRKVVIE